MDKYQRNYVLKIDVPGGEAITIQPPFTVEFDVNRNDFGSSNYGQIRIHNLSENIRSKLRQDPSDLISFRNVTFRAGYGFTMPIVLLGKISQAGSVREGTEFITTLQVFDGGFAATQAYTSLNFPGGTPHTDIIAGLITDLSDYGVSQGSIGNYEGTTKRGTAFTGSTTKALDTFTGGGFFIDNGKAHALGDDEAFEGEIDVITSASGLLGTPVREGTRLIIEMLFEPRLVVGQVLSIKSITAANYNAEYKVVGFHHRGTISDSVSGSATTEITLACPNLLTLIQAPKL